MSNETLTADELTAGTEHYPLERGDTAHDRGAVYGPRDDGEVLVMDVLDSDVYTETYFDRDAGENVRLSDLDANQRYSDFGESTRVLSVAFAGWLDANCPRWRSFEDREETFEYLANMDAQFGIVPKTYSYPEARLIPDDAV